MYFGGFADHKRSGEGTMMDDTLNQLYEGIWTADKPNDKAVAALTMRVPDVYITF